MSTEGLWSIFALLAASAFFFFFLPLPVYCYLVMKKVRRATVHFVDFACMYYQPMFMSLNKCPSFSCFGRFLLLAVAVAGQPCKDAFLYIITFSWVDATSLGPCFNPWLKTSFFFLYIKKLLRPEKEVHGKAKP